MGRDGILVRRVCVVVRKDWGKRKKRRICSSICAEEIVAAKRECAMNGSLCYLSSGEQAVEKYICVRILEKQGDIKI